jgi:hypothetical protein
MASPLLFHELIERLRREDFPVGPDQVLRMYTLLSRVEEVSPDDLKTLLCPIFATSGEEQQRFYRAYDEFFSIRVPAATDPKQRPRSLPLGGPAAPAPRKDGGRRESFDWKRWTIPAVVILLIALAAALLWRDISPEKIGNPPPTATESTTTGEPPPPLQTTRNPWLYVLGAGLVLCGAEVARTLVRWLQQRERRGEGRPFDWPLRDAAPPAVFAASSFYRASRLLKGREASEYERLDIARTIDVTIRAMGDPTFAYAVDRRVSEYLILIERRSDRDHLAALAASMAQALVRDGVLLEVYEYESDPRSCSKPGTSVRVSTIDLYHRYPQHRLIVIGPATPFSDPVTGVAHEWIPRMFPWSWRALLTPDDECASARFVEPWFDVFGLAENGLLRLAERWQYPDAAARPFARRHSKAHLPDDLPSSVRGIEAALDPLLFAWLLRCAVHPTLQWELTRALAPPAGDEERLHALIALCRLPWFREGRIPEPLRLALVRHLATNRGEDDGARSVTLRLLAATPPPPPTSVAARSLEIEQIAHQLWRARGDRAALRPLVRGLRRFPRGLVVRDRALLQLLREEAPGQPVARKLPSWARRLVYRDGIPAFGAHSLIGLLFVVPIVIYANVAIQRAADERDLSGSQSGRPDTGDATLTNSITTFETVASQTVVTSATDTSGTDMTPTSGTTGTSGTSATSGTHPAIEPLTLLQPADGATVEVQRGGTMRFGWTPSGTYRMQIRTARGPLISTEVEGASWNWKPIAAPDNVFSWRLESPQRTTNWSTFRYRAIERRLDEEPSTRKATEYFLQNVDCGVNVEGDAITRFKLIPGEVITSAEVQVSDQKNARGTAYVTSIQGNEVTFVQSVTGTQQIQSQMPCHAGYVQFRTIAIIRRGAAAN